MSNLRRIRIVLAAIFLIAATLLLLGYFSETGALRILRDIQILPSEYIIASSSVATLSGVTLFWLLTTFLFGRIYCATICPVGTLLGLTATIRRKTRFRKRFSFAQPKPVRFNILWIYILTLVISQLTVPFLIEPWNIARNIISPFHPEILQFSWSIIGAPALCGFVAGGISLVGLLLWGWLSGREFCTSICPIGTALGFVASYSPIAIAIDPDRCSGCLKCEDVCSAKSIKVISRHVDNTRCVRCLDCIDVCPDKAIGFSSNRNRPASPLLRKAKTP